MAKNTAVFIFILSILAALLFGINIGKKIGIPQSSRFPSPTPTNLPITNNHEPITITSISSSPSATINPKSSKLETSTFTDTACGFTITFKSSYLNQSTENGRSLITINADNPNDAIVTACQEEIPKPPLPTEKIEDITLDKVTAKLYHDQNSKDGSPRDELIVKHPKNGQEIIIAGFGPTFTEAIKNFKFIK